MLRAGRRSIASSRNLETRATLASHARGVAFAACRGVFLYFKSAEGAVPAEEFLDEVPTDVEAHLYAVLDAVAAAPPPQFSGGGKWEAMRGNMRGWYEVRCSGPGREQFRLFCLLENGTPERLKQLGLAGPALVVITGMRKPHRTVFSDRDYQRVRELGDEYRALIPRLVV
jgi:hypothetical protein